MSDERLEILRMVSDGAINPEEGERLLRALHDGEQQRPSGGSGSRERRGEGVSGVLDSVRSAVATIGPAIRDVVDEVQDGLQADIDLDVDDGDDERPGEQSKSPAPFRVDDGTSLLVRSDRRRGRGRADLVLIGVPGDECTVTGDEARNIRISHEDGSTVVRWSKGTLTVRVPATVRKLAARTKGGDVATEGIACEMQIKTMGGDLELGTLQADFEAKTMGGSVGLDLVPGWRGDSVAHTMGGSVVANFPAGLGETVITAATFGGTIRGVGSMHTDEHGTGIGVKKRVFRIGRGGEPSSLKLKTMGGDITLRGAEVGNDHESHSTEVGDVERPADER